MRIKNRSSPKHSAQYARGRACDLFVWGLLDFFCFVLCPSPPISYFRFFVFDGGGASLLINFTY